MRKQYVATWIFLILILVTLVSYIPVECSYPVSVGAYYYVWYDGHWNTPGEPRDTVVDTPLLGYYSSQNETVIKQHLDWMKDIGLDFLIISWWGPNSYEDNSTKKVFETVKSYAGWMKLAIMVEGFNETFGPQGYNFTDIYNYLFETYIYPYNETYMEIDGRPLVCWFNFQNMTAVLPSNRDAIHNNTSVQARIVGQSDYCDWWFGTPWSGSADDKPTVYKDNEICVEPRYDDTHLGWGNHSYDVDYSQGLYDKEWSEALNYAEQGQVKLVTIYSWNEYHERSQIEPHITDGDYVLSVFARTRSYIDRIKSTEQTSSNPWPYLVVGILVGAILTWLYLRFRGRGSYIKEKIASERQTQKEEEEAQEASKDRSCRPLYFNLEIRPITHKNHGEIC